MAARASARRGSVADPYPPETWSGASIRKPVGRATTLAVALTTAGIPPGDPLVAALRGALASRGPVLGPADLGRLRPGAEGADAAGLAHAPLHVHVAAEPADLLSLLRLLRGAGIPLRAEGRGRDQPFLVLCGPAALPNPEPAAAFFDAVLVGDAPVALAAAAGAWAGAAGGGRDAVLAAWLGCDGVYVPAAYRPAYGEEGVLEALTPPPGAAPCVRARWAAVASLGSGGSPDPAGRPGLRAMGPGVWTWDHGARGEPRGATAVLGAVREALRRAAGVPLSDAQVDEALDRVAAAGAAQVELEFTLGLPGETDADLEGIVELVKRLRHRLLQGSRGARKVPEIVPAVSTFFPLPWTATQWAPLADARDLARKHKELARALARVGNVSLLHDVPKWAHVRAVLARGDRRMAGLFELALKTGGDWGAACRRWVLNADFFAYRWRDPGELFPWDHLDVGISKDVLREEARARGLLAAP